MRLQKRIPWLFSLGAVLVAATLWGAPAGAQNHVSSDQPGSIVIWPKVIADGTRDTLIKLTNTSNGPAYAHCEYTQGTGFCSLTDEPCSLTRSDSCPEIPGASANLCVISWQTGNFDVILTRQQPTIWRVSTGRMEDPFLPADGECDQDFPQHCPGLFPTEVPPPPQGNSPFISPFFRGDLRCIQVAMDLSTPIGGDALKGEAIIETLGSNQISEYNAINVPALEGPLTGDTLKLDGVQYAACPPALDLMHYTNNPGAEDLVAEKLGANCGVFGCPVRTELTFIPCRAEYGTEEGTPFNVSFELVDEFESPFTALEPFDCWATISLDDLFPAGVGSAATFMRTRVTPSGSGLCLRGTNQGLIGCTTDAACGTGGVCGPASGILAILEEFHETDNSIGQGFAPAVDAANAHIVARSTGSLQRTGVCRVGHAVCTSDAGCPAAGLCRINSTTPCMADATCEALDPNDFCDRCMNDEIVLAVD